MCKPKLRDTKPPNVANGGMHAGTKCTRTCTTSPFGVQGTGNREQGTVGTQSINYIEGWVVGYQTPTYSPPHRFRGPSPLRTARIAVLCGCCVFPAAWSSPRPTRQLGACLLCCRFRKLLKPILPLQCRQVTISPMLPNTLLICPGGQAQGICGCLGWFAGCLGCLGCSACLWQVPQQQRLVAVAPAGGVWA